jgi:peptide deformylase
MKLTIYPNQILLNKCREVTEDELLSGVVMGHNLKQLRRDMIETMRQNKGCGLAAPQVGLNVRLFIADATGDFPFMIINPVLHNMASRAPAVEGCLSIPNVHGYVMRYERLTMTGMALDLTPIEMKVKDAWLARIIQHETDHLDGKLFIDVMSESDKQKYAGVLDFMRRTQAAA